MESCVKFNFKTSLFSCIFLFEDSLLCKIELLVLFSIIFVLLASPDALEVIVVTDLLSVRTDLTDVTLVSDDTYWKLD